MTCAINYHLLRRKIVNAIMLSLTGVCTLITAGVLCFILSYLFWNGAKNLNWAFLTELPKPVGELGGGMAHAIVGTAKMLVMATAIGFPIGSLAGVYLSEFGKGRFSSVVRFVTDLLNGVPSIVIGVFVYALLVIPLKHFSAIAGGVALGILMIPVAVRSTEEFLQGVPQNLREGAMALGASKWRAVATVVIPAAGRGIITAVMLGLARVAGETAPLIFTAFGNAFWSKSIHEPTASLPVMIYTYAISPYEDWHRQAWAAGFLLLTSIFVINILARVVVARGFSTGRRS
jgi:phosphate transport system permease protein